MADQPRSGPKVPQQRADPKEAARKPKGEDRPGFDLGGASGETSGVSSTVVPGGPKGSTSNGADAGGRATGMTDPSGSRSLGDDGNAGSAAGAGSTNSSGRGS